MQDVLEKLGTATMYIRFRQNSQDSVRSGGGIEEGTGESSKLIEEATVGMALYCALVQLDQTIEREAVEKALEKTSKQGLR